MRKIGYARALEGDKSGSIDEQIKALMEYGCEKIYYERGSASKENRSEFVKMLDNIVPDDILVCWKLDRLCRSIYDFALLINKLKPFNTSIISINDSIDTSRNDSFDLGSLADFFSKVERKNASEMTKEGVRKARERGVKLGRPKGFSKATLEKYSQIDKMRADGMNIKEIAIALETSRSAVYRYLQYIQDINKKS